MTIRRRFGHVFVGNVASFRAWLRDPLVWGDHVAQARQSA